jgi:AcrR family transcriptional regulator
MDMGKQEMLDEAIAHAREKGLARSSLREVADAIGTSHRMLLYHFGSRAGLLREIVARNEAEERVRAQGYAEERLMPRKALERTWRRLRRPSRAGEERLFFELAAMAMYRTPGTERVGDDMVKQWMALAKSAGVDAAQLRVDVAVIRGLLLDLLLTGDRKGTDAALKAYLDMRNAR